MAVWTMRKKGREKERNPEDGINTTKTRKEERGKKKREEEHKNKNVSVTTDK
jgi:hypothetical protein